MAIVVGHVTHDVDYEFANTADETVQVTAGVWSVLSCRAGHTVEGDLEDGTKLTCPECGE